MCFSVFGWIKSDPRKKKTIHIGKEVWIGDNVTILPFVTHIADGAVVTKNIPPYEIYGGAHTL